MAKYFFVGQPVPRPEGAEKVSGQAVYTADRMLPGMIWGKALRSPHAHARIVKIDTARAKSFSGVLAVLTAKEVSERLIGRRLRDMPLLARDRVRFVGERIAVVAAEEPQVAEAAAALIEVEYEELPALFDPKMAMSKDAPLLHPDLAAYVHLPPNLPAIPNLHSLSQWHMGDCANGFDEADFIFEQTFTTQRVHQGFLEPTAAVAASNSAGRILVWASNKVPFQTRQYLAQLLGVDEKQILFQLGPVGGDFGGKGSLMDLPLCYYLAKSTGRPVKMVMSYHDELTAGNPRHPSIITLKTGVKADGKLWAREATIIFDSGAYAGFKPNEAVNLPGARHGAGAYKIPNVKIDAFSVYTNTVPSGHMRGPGEPQLIFAVESHMDYLARQLGKDPIEFRRINMLKPGDQLFHGLRWESNKGAAVLNAMSKQIGAKPRPRPGAYYGKGVAFCAKEVNIGECNVEVGIGDNGAPYILTTVPETGAGAHTIFRQIAAEALKTPPSEIEVRLGNTDNFERDLQLGGSRVTYLAGQAILSAVTALQHRLIREAAALLDCAEDAIKIANKKLRQSSGKSISFAALARQANSRAAPLIERGYFAPKEKTGAGSFFGQSVELEIDGETGQIKILKIVATHDVGTIINPILHQGQIEGGLIQGLGFAVLEDLIAQDGTITTANMGEYKIPNVADIPDLKTVLIKDDGGPGPYQSKPIGESSINPSAPAIANAIYDALGVQIIDLPITAEKVYRALQQTIRARPATKEPL